MNHNYKFTTNNGRCIVWINDMIFFMFNQIDFKGLYFYKDDVNLYGLDIYLVNNVRLEIYFKTKQTWLAVNKLLSKHL